MLFFSSFPTQLHFVRVSYNLKYSSRKLSKLCSGVGMQLRINWSIYRHNGFFIHCCFQLKGCTTVLSLDFFRFPCTIWNLIWGIAVKHNLIFCQHFSWGVGIAIFTTDSQKTWRISTIPCQYSHHETMKVLKRYWFQVLTPDATWRKFNYTIHHGRFPINNKPEVIDNKTTSNFVIGRGWSQSKRISREMNNAC